MNLVGISLRRIGVILEMIKFEHTVFALPFALTSAIIAADGFPPWHTMAWITAAMVGARSSAMAFNRIVDRDYDRLNDRTSGRALPRGTLRLAEVWLFTAVSSGIFVFAAFMLNRLAFYLSPVALAVILGYSYSKRFTALSHLWLGLALGIAPVGAWIGVTGRLELPSMLLSAVVILWTAGFDIIYALQDLDFDRKLGLFSMPRLLGAAGALRVSRAFHFAAFLLLLGFGRLLGMGTVYYAGAILVGALLAYEQHLVNADDLSRLNVAFFNANGFVSMGYFLFTAGDLIIRKAGS